MSQTDLFLDVGKRIAELRGGLTQAVFAERLGVDRKTVVGWEAGKRLPDGSSLLKLMTEFAADANYLLTGRESGSAAPQLSHRETALIDNYRHTDVEGQKVIEGTANMAAQSKARKKA